MTEYISPKVLLLFLIFAPPLVAVYISLRQKLLRLAGFKRVCPAFQPRQTLRFSIGHAQARPLNLRQFGYTRGDKVVVMSNTEFTRLLEAARQRTNRNGMRLMLAMVEAGVHYVELAKLEKNITEV